jgi:hypothetical protein
MLLFSLPWREGVRGRGQKRKFLVQFRTDYNRKIAKIKWKLLYD